MTVREWKHIGWAIFVLSAYSTIVNLLGLRGLSFIIAVVIGLAILMIFVHRFMNYLSI